MSNRADYIEQSGLVIATTNGKMKVTIVGNSGCSACHNSLCMLGDSKSKELEVTMKNALFQIGEEVLIRINPTSAYLGLILLYLLPFLLLVGLLIGFLQMGYAESIAGTISLGSLVPYFLFLFLFRKQLATQCRVNIIKKV
ncbi:MAG: SoxR reducing system RseC family protein [Cytophagales bacterium]|nr:SoxR reducing system RseC family protein [Cytophagales bacterium]MCA6373820.1 SoxR reducing system RseC family protein [Cytophagales bacterium]MCA6383439.1 SoxR reducing system RseC family protein [Cytophagales bacterium]